jgi:hypothetical protein
MDVIMKSIPNKALKRMVLMNYLEIGIQGYIKRPDIGV